MNKVLRLCFEKWKTSNEEYLLGNVEYNKKFFKDLFYELAIIRATKTKNDIKIAYEYYLNLFLKTSQMDRKQRKKIYEDMHSRKPKYINLVLRTTQLDICQDLKKHSKLFAESFEEVKKSYIDSFKNLEFFNETKLDENFERFNNFRNKKNYGIDIESMLRICLTKIKKYQRESKIELNSKFVKNTLKHVKFPFTLREIKELFKII